MEQANAVIEESESALRRVNNEDWDGAFQKLKFKLDVLKELLVQDDNNEEAVTDAIDELKKVGPHCMLPIRHMLTRTDDCWSNMAH